MKIVFTLCIILEAMTLFGQNNGDTKIIIKVSDTNGIYEKVKHSMVNTDFIIKDNGSRDTLTTYSREYNGIFCMARAIIKDQTVVLTGVYGLKRIDDFGYTQSPKNYNRIIYYKGSKSWKLLMQVANKVGGQINFDK